MRYTQPPQELSLAISRAAGGAGVPFAVLVGIWRIESGSTFPNPAVNSSGYGGLFGTRNWSASTQAQADEAASILATGLQRAGGNIAGALAYYNTGDATSSAGLDYAQRVLAASGAGSAYTAQQTQAARPRPGASGSGNPFANVWGDVSAVGAAIGAGSESALEGAWSGVLGALNGPWEVLKAFLWLSDPRTWLRILEALLGVALMAGSLALLARVLFARAATLGVPGLAAARAAAPRTGIIRAAGSSSSSSSARRASSSSSRRPPDELAAARARTERERTAEVRARRRRSLEEARDRRRQRDERERRAFWQGVREAGGS
jgi:hypothetical protein